MLEATTRIYVRDPECEDNLVPGVVAETLGQKVMVRFLQPVFFQAGARTVFYYHNENNCFTSAPCQMQRMFSSGHYPTGALVMTGEPEIAESRSTYRVDVHNGSVVLCVRGEDKGEVINLSCGGVGAMMSSDSYQFGQWLDVTLQYDGDEHPGRMQVRSVFQDKDKRFRYGLMADPEEPSLISQLSRITQELQNVKARRVSRIGVNNKANASKSGDANDGTDAEDKNEQDEQDGPSVEELVSDPGTKRQHQRNSWPGMAKVYIREDHNLRVLSVDTRDLSRGGISFVSPQYIYEESEVLFEKPIAGGVFRVMVAIRNVQVLKGGVHRVGAQFLGAPLQQGNMPDGFEDVCKVA